MKSSAWKRLEDTTYGYGKFPFGRCTEDDCPEAACFRVPDTDNDNGQKLVCLDHKPKKLFFVPFLGQQEKLVGATERYVLGGGGAGGSKTFAGARLWLKQHGPEHERWRRGEIEHSEGWAIFFRRILSELRAVITDFKRYHKKVNPRGKWNQQEKIWECECGFQVQFGGMENDDDWEKYYGNQYTLVVFDEAWQFTKKQITEIDSRIRCGDPVLSAQVQLYLLTNPIGSETKKWMKRRFVDVADPETPVLMEVKLADGRTIQEWQVYIPSNMYDNPALVRDGKYEANLRKKSALQVRILLTNDWTADEGAWVGEDWDVTRHVIFPHSIPSSWPKWKDADYGFASKSVCHWGATDPSGGHVIYRAISCKGLTVREFGNLIKEIESKPLWWTSPSGRRVKIVDVEWDHERDCTNVRGPMDAALWQRHGEDGGETRGEILESIGTGFYPSDKGTKVRHQAAEHIRGKLRELVPDPFREGEVTPGLRFFRDTTETRMFDEDGAVMMAGPIHTLPTLPADTDDPDVPDTDADDHDWDALAYGLMSRQGPGGEPEAEVIDFLSIRAGRAAAAGPGGHINW